MAMQALVFISLFLSMLAVNDSALADGLSYFDFNGVPISTKKKSDSAAQIESYMETIYGAEITVGPTDRKGRTTVRATNDPGRGIKELHLANADTNPLGVFAPAPAFSDTFLMSGKGKNPGIVITFEDSPIYSFAVDWQLFKKARGLTIKADGEIIFERELTKGERKQGLLGHQDRFFFDGPVHTLEFIGWKKSKFGIDNLAVNFPVPSNSEFAGGAEDPTEPGLFNEPGEIFRDLTLPRPTSPLPTTIEIAADPIESVPEPATLILLGLGLFMLLAWGSFAPGGLLAHAQWDDSRMKPYKERVMQE